MGKWNGPESNAQHNGPPKGSTNFAKNKPWRDAIGRALSKKGSCDRAEVLYEIAEKLIECALDSTSPHYQFAVKEIGLRMDGKPREHIEIGADGGHAALSLGISAAFRSLANVAITGEVIEAEVTESCILTAEPMDLEQREASDT